METFNDLALNPALQRAVQELGFVTPSPIQAQTLPILLTEKTDFIGLAATGTGKTAAFTLPLLEQLKPDVRGVQAIILCPTRELCLQVAGQVDLLGKFSGVRALPIYGGAGYEEQLRGLKQGASVVVGTPGRVMDHMRRKSLRLDNVQIVVLDEADEMISMGFREAMETILDSVPREQSQIWMFSATMSKAVRRIADEFLRDYKRVEVNRTEVVPTGVEQIYFMTHEKNKPEVLCKLIDAADDFYGIIFCQTKSMVIDLTRYLNGRGYNVDCLHGDMSQSSRETAMMAFRQKGSRIIVCTDVASRGLDVKDVTHVINYSLPRELDSYVHRIGRTARSGKAGVAMALVTPSHKHLIAKIEKVTRSKMSEGVIPTRRSIGMKKIAQMLESFQGQPEAHRALELMDDAWKSAVAQMTGPEVAARFLTMMFPWVFVEKDRPQPMERTDKRPEVRAERDSKQERRNQKRQDKRDFKKKFSKGFHGKKKKAPHRDWPQERA